MKEPSIVYVMPAQEYNKKLANALKNIPEFKPPEWSFFVKSGTSKVRPPQNPDFWYTRAASILRQIYIRKVVGVNRLRTRYGSRKKRGVKPEHFYKASGKIIRVILQQAEKAGLIEKYNEIGKRAGRRLTKYGISFMENIK
ncbi:MAG: 30S ribosomal protein S19e [Candidatus Pacearchaeota archaeon]